MHTQSWHIPVYSILKEVSILNLKQFEIVIYKFLSASGLVELTYMMVVQQLTVSYWALILSSRLLSQLKEGQVGVKAMFQVLMPEDSGSSPDAGSIINYYLTQEIFPPTPEESLPNLTPPSGWARHVCSIGDPQFGLAVCCVVSACDSTDTRELPMMVIHYTHHTPTHPHTQHTHSSKAMLT